MVRTESWRFCFLLDLPMAAKCCSGDGTVADSVGLVCFLDAGRSAERTADGVVVPKRSMVTVGWRPRLQEGQHCGATTSLGRRCSSRGGAGKQKRELTLSGARLER